MLNSPSRDEPSSYMNTSGSANNKGTGNNTWSGKHDYPFWFKVVTDSVSKLWNNSQPQAAAWSIRVKTKWKTFTQFWPQKSYTQNTKCEQVSGTWRGKYPYLNEDKNNQFHNTFCEHCHSINIVFRLLENKCPPLKLLTNLHFLYDNKEQWRQQSKNSSSTTQSWTNLLTPYSETAPPRIFQRNLGQKATNVASLHNAVHQRGGVPVFLSN